MSAQDAKIPLSQSELTKGLLNAIESIQINIDAYLNGKGAGWLAVGAQLYILLCDPNPSNSLLSRLLPSICFYPLATQIERPKDKDDVTWLIHSPAPVHFEPNKVTVELFDLSKPKMPMKRWLKQIVGVHNYRDKGHYVTVENLIHYARNQLGAGHLDPEWEAITKSLEFPKIHMQGEDYPFYEWAIILIGHTVIDEVRQALKTLPPA